MITLDRLRYFIEAATSEHVGRASKILSVSPSVISSAIRELEEEFNCELFTRESKRIKLNAKGQILLEKARILLEDTKQLHAELSHSSLTLKGHYKLGASHFLMHEYLIPAFLEIQKEHPQLTVEFIALDTGVAVSQILAGNLDAALVFRSYYYHELDESILAHEQFNIAVRKNHPILKKTKKDVVEALNDLPTITFRTSFGPNFWQNHPSFKTQGIIPKHTYFYDDTYIALQLLKKTPGWAFLPDRVIQRNKDIQKISLSENLNAPVNISMIRNKNSFSSRFIEELNEKIRSKLG